MHHEPEVFAFLLKKMAGYDTVVEIGANVGLYTIFFSKLLPRPDDRPRILSFEPSRRAFAELPHPKSRF